MKTNLLIFLSLLLLGSCTTQPQYIETNGQLHTPYRILYQYTESLDGEIHAELKRYYHSLNPFDSLSIISQVNRNKEVEVDTLFAEVFRKAREVSSRTDGMYDITCAPLINLWGFGFSKMDSVTPQMIDSIRSFVGYQKVRLEGRHIIKDDPRLLLNCSSMGDGCSCEVIARLLESKGIPTHFVEELSDRETVVKKVKIVPLEVIVRNIAAGSMSKRLGIEEGTVLPTTVLEYSYKNDDLGDPLINDYHALAMQLCTREELDQIASYAFKINEILKAFFKEINVDLVDFKLEFGKLSDGTIVLADEISPDTCRFWDATTHEKLDKDRFRRDMDNVDEGYHEIMKRLLGE